MHRTLSHRRRACPAVPAPIEYGSLVMHICALRWQVPRMPVVWRGRQWSSWSQARARAEVEVEAARKEAVRAVRWGNSLFSRRTKDGLCAAQARVYIVEARCEICRTLFEQ